MTSRGALDSKKESKENINNLTGLKDSTLETRRLRGQGTKPLNASGSLLASIKSSKGTLSFNKYGLYQEEGFTTRNLFYINGHQFDFREGAKIPPRPWVFRKYKKENIDKFFKDFHKALSK